MIFLDHNAGAPPHPRVRDRLRSLLAGEDWANPSSPHRAGRAAKELVEEAREMVARSVGGAPTQLTFTSGATEANAAAIRHWALQAGERRTIVSTAVEHPSVMEPLRRLEREGWRLRWAPVDRRGSIPADWIGSALGGGDVAFAVCMSANNETGALHPWRAWAFECAELGIPLHMDATQSWGREDVHVEGVRGSVAWSGHKVGGLSGAGALWLSETRGFTGLALGGPQERGRRAGTESVLAIAALGEAVGVPSSESTRSEWRRWIEILWERVADIPGVSRTVEARLCWLHERPAKVRSRYLLQHGIRRIHARIDAIRSVIHPESLEAVLDAETLTLNDIGDVTITAAVEVFYDRYQDNKANGAFIIIDESTNDTVGVGFLSFGIFTTLTTTPIGNWNNVGSPPVTLPLNK